MSDLADEIKRSLKEFFSKASADDIKQALKDAGYQEYTGIDPFTLDIKPGPIDFDELAEEIEIEQSQKENAWELAQVIRTCPPDRIIFQTVRTPEFIAHLNRCPICRKNVRISKESLAAWKKLAEKIGSSFPNVLSNEFPAPEKGQIWLLSPMLEGWGDQNRYYRTPVVVIIGRHQDSNMLIVSQLHDHEELAGPQDVPLNDPAGFAEAWNIYRIREEDLGTFLGRISEEKILQIEAEASDIKGFIDYDGMICRFRTLETEVGDFIIRRIHR